MQFRAELRVPCVVNVSKIRSQAGSTKRRKMLQQSLFFNIAR